MRLIFLHGLPGVGKLTVARELARLTNYKLFHNHLAVDLVGSVFEFGTHPFVELREMIWLAMFKRAAEEHLNGLIFTLHTSQFTILHSVSSSAFSGGHEKIACSPGCQ